LPCEKGQKIAFEKNKIKMGKSNKNPKENSCRENHNLMLEKI
jgi:hypothetical protein